jgi:hypothetical protein
MEQEAVKPFISTDLHAAKSYPVKIAITGPRSDITRVQSPIKAIKKSVKRSDVRIQKVSLPARELPQTERIIQFQLAANRSDKMEIQKISTKEADDIKPNILKEEVTVEKKRSFGQAIKGIFKRKNKNDSTLTQ